MKKTLARLAFGTTVGRIVLAIAIRVLNKDGAEWAIQEAGYMCRKLDGIRRIRRERKAVFAFNLMPRVDSAYVD